MKSQLVFIFVEFMPLYLTLSSLISTFQSNNDNLKVPLGTPLENKVVSKSDGLFCCPRERLVSWIFYPEYVDGFSFVREMRLAAAEKWYEMGKVSQSKAAELTGLSRQEFLRALNRFNVSPFQVTPNELKEEIADA